ncbi:MAG TPA: galactokinase family protein [Exilispira sp.]|nr:galactokinase family protein [Exilispira sp.]
MNSVCVRSPGRINFIGEHIDYIETYSCPATIDHHNDITILKTSGNSIRIYSDKFGDSKDIGFNQIYDLEKYDFSKFWYGYFIGILRALNDKGIKITSGFEVKVVSNLADGAGLSSSASIELGFLYGLNELFSLSLSPIDMVKISKYSENKYMNAPCGILDQYTIMFGKKNCFLYLDYNELTHSFCSLPDDLKFFIIDTKIKHSIASEGYKSRIDQKNKISDILQTNFKLSIREATIKSIDDYKFYSDVILKLDDSTLNKRFNHFVSETDRTMKFYQFIKENNIEKAFNLLNQSHISLSSLYEVSTPEIDELVFGIQNLPNVLGARMIGGGFGGSCLVVTKENFDIGQLENIVNKINKKYGLKIEFFEIKIDDSVHLL